MPRKGLMLVFTGNGKGKTTAAMGMALRAIGHGMRVMMVQFIKGNFEYGEIEGAKRLAPNFELAPRGLGCITVVCGRPSEASEEEHRQAAREAFAFATEVITSDRYDLVILDEVTYIVNFGFVSLDDLLALIHNRPPRLHVVLTGRNAPPLLIDAADLVTEMVEVKHPYKLNVSAARGVEF